MTGSWQFRDLSSMVLIRARLIRPDREGHKRAEHFVGGLYQRVAHVARLGPRQRFDIGDCREYPCSFRRRWTGDILGQQEITHRFPDIASRIVWLDGFDSVWQGPPGGCRTLRIGG
jgi:hypothetical protein